MKTLPRTVGEAFYIRILNSAAVPPKPKVSLGGLSKALVLIKVNMELI